MDGVHQVLSYETFLGAGIPERFLPQEARSLSRPAGRLLLVNSSYKSGSDAQNAQLDEMTALVKQYDPNGVITGEGAMTRT